METPFRCDIIIPVWNELEHTRACIESIGRHTGIPYRLIVVDNASDAPTASYLGRLDTSPDRSVTLVRNGTNLGFVKAVNQGLRLAEAPYLCILNNDTVVFAGWLEEMIALAEADETIAMVNPSSNTSGEVPPAGMPAEAYAASLRRHAGETQELSNCRGFCMLLRRAVVERAGFFDEAYDLGYFEETDYSRKISRLGFRIVRAKGAYVHHAERASFKRLDRADALFGRNERIFNERWGRPVRVGLFVDRAGEEACVIALVAEILRRAGRVHLFLKRGLSGPAAPDHFDLRIKELPAFAYWAAAAYELIRRKRKKGIDVAVALDRRAGAFLASLAFAHGARILVRPSRETLLAVMQEKERVF